MKQALPENNHIPCLLCECDMPVQNPSSTLADIRSSNFDNGVECRTQGNYGSSRWDMNGTIYFVICDSCLVNHSNKMIVIEGDGCPWTKGQPNKPARNGKEYFDAWEKQVEQDRIERASRDIS
jgi:hypothetical protein